MSSGISSRHAGHHVAQKLIENDFSLVTFHVYPAFIDCRQRGMWHGLIHVGDVAGIARESLCEPGKIGTKIKQGDHANDRYDEKQ